jgi:hypothetical protein
MDKRGAYLHRLSAIHIMFSNRRWRFITRNCAMNHLRARPNPAA